MRPSVTEDPDGPRKLWAQMKAVEVSRTQDPLELPIPGMVEVEGSFGRRYLVPKWVLEHYTIEELKVLAP